MEAGMLCNVDGEKFYLFTNNYIGLYNITDINKFVQGSSGDTSDTKKGKLCVKVHQVNSSKKLLIL